jgi:hypothetical protein
MKNGKGKRGRPKGSKNRPVTPVRIIKNADVEVQGIAEKLNMMISLMNEIEAELKHYRSSAPIRQLIRAGKPRRRTVKRK